MSNNSLSDRSIVDYFYITPFYMLSRIRMSHPYQVANHVYNQPKIIGYLNNNNNRTVNRFFFK